MNPIQIRFILFLFGCIGSRLLLTVFSAFSSGIMLKILGEHYYLDLDKIDEYIQIKQEPSSSSGETDGTQINVVKYETIKLMLDVVMDDGEEVDETLAGKGSEISIPFKLAFNTLLNKKLLNKY